MFKDDQNNILSSDHFEKTETTKPIKNLIQSIEDQKLSIGIKLLSEKVISQNNVLEEKNARPEHDFFFVKKKDSLVKLMINDIRYIRVEGRYCEAITEKGNFIIQVSLHQFMKELPKPDFLRTHRNFIVNAKKIEEIYLDDNLIVLVNNEKVLLSRRFKDAFLKKYKVYT